MSDVTTLGPAADDQAPALFWESLIDEKLAANFLNLSPRTLQAKRVSAAGPKFVRLSARCVKYRRCDLRAWLEDRLRTSTSDTGKAA